MNSDTVLAIVNQALIENCEVEFCLKQKIVIITKHEKRHVIKKREQAVKLLKYFR